MRLYLSPAAEYIIASLNAAGFEAFAVGGCVRDMLMGKAPSDWDIATNALPQQAKNIFPKTFDTGLQHGTVTVLAPQGLDNGSAGRHFEITTYRSEGAYLDNRRPSEVTFETDLAKDLSRRDFTVNAMAYNNLDGLIDPFGGRVDIENKIIGCVGNPSERFKEDALRMMRAVRFACALGFDIENATFAAIAKDAARINNISAERINAELCKALLGDYPERLDLLHQTGLDNHILPELKACFDTPQVNPYHIYNVGEHILKVVASTPKDLEIRLAALLHDMGKPPAKTTDAKGIDHFKGHGDIGAAMAKEMMRRLRFDNKTADNVTRLVKYHDAELGSELGVRRSSSRVGADLFLKLLALERADCAGQNPQKAKPKLDGLDRAEIYFNAERRNMCLSINELAIDGRDLLDVGYAEGQTIGKILKGLLKAVIKRPELNSRDELLKMAKGMKI